MLEPENEFIERLAVCAENSLVKRYAADQSTERYRRAKQRTVYFFVLHCAALRMPNCRVRHKALVVETRLCGPLLIRPASMVQDLGQRPSIPQLIDPERPRSGLGWKPQEICCWRGHADSETELESAVGIMSNPRKRRKGGVSLSASRSISKSDILLEQQRDEHKLCTPSDHTSPCHGATFWG
jgi:hypothetical protein